MVGMLQRVLHIELLCPCPRSLENGGQWEKAPHLTHGQTGVGWCPVRELRLTGVVDVLLMKPLLTVVEYFSHEWSVLSKTYNETTEAAAGLNESGVDPAERR